MESLNLRSALKTLFQSPDSIVMLPKNLKTRLNHRHQNFLCTEQVLIDPTLKALDSSAFLKISEV